MTDVPELTTERLVLRGPVGDDFAIFAAFYASDAARYIGGPLGIADAWRLFAADVGHWSLKGFGWWTVIEDDTVVGSVGLHHPAHHDDIEIGWNTYSGAEGRGIATEAATAALNWAASVLKPERLVSYIAESNLASMKLAERLGATLQPGRASHAADNLIYLHDLSRYAK
ncbi:GNAT family N-acetyltransferase [Roseovarius phycicola]|uniref:GNAT family N-acetyltransferase n=1 Tax=Roseovarius phycicola TaxID=3080976 RepID=A0ABZ2HIX0_9RHOB